MDPPPPVSRQLWIAVVASLIIVTLGLANFALDFLPGDYAFGAALMLSGGAVLFGAGLCGTFCGFVALFRVRGFQRFVAVVSALVSLYGITRCAGFFGWAINLP